VTVLVVVEDPQLAELLLEALADAGHTGVTGGDPALCDAAIVDFDTRARDGAATVELLRRCAPATTVVALLPCGGLPGRSIPCDLSFEKPARLRSVLAALVSRS
jgi:hypothetical protein